MNFNVNVNVNVNLNMTGTRNNFSKISKEKSVQLSDLAKSRNRESVHPNAVTLEVKSIRNASQFRTIDQMRKTNGLTRNIEVGSTYINVAKKDSIPKIDNKMMFKTSDKQFVKENDSLAKSAIIMQKSAAKQKINNLNLQQKIGIITRNKSKGLKIKLSGQGMANKFVLKK